MNKGPKRHYLIILLVFAIFFVISFITNILNSIMADVKSSFNLNLFLAGLLPFAFFIAYGVMSVPAGFLSERYNDQKLLGYSFLLITVASGVFILMPGYWVFGFTLFVMGCSMAVMQVIVNPLLRVAGGEEHFAFNSVLAQLVFGGASFLSPYLYMYLVNDQDPDILVRTLTSLVPENLPWVSLYILFAGIALIMWGIIKFIPYPDYEKTEEERSGSVKTYLKLLKNKWSVLYFLGIFCYVGTEQGIGNWISQFLFEYHELNPQTTGANTVSGFWAYLTIGCLLGLLLLKILDSRIVLIFSSLATIITLIIALTATAEWSVKAFPAIGFFISVMWSVIFSLGLNSVKDYHGALSGILCTGIAGGAVMPLIVGSLGDLFELKTGMFFLIVPLLYILSIGFWARPLVQNQTFKFNKDKP